MGQPIAGSNPALSATPSRVREVCRTPGVGRAPVLLSSAGRARRGTSGALYLQSAPAGLNSLPRSPLSRAAASSDVEDRVPRSGDSRTVSGPEGSSTKRSSSGAAERPGPSRSLRWARGASGSTEGARHFASRRRPPQERRDRDSHRTHRTRPSTAAGAPRRSARSSARRPSSTRSATPSGPAGSPRDPVRRPARHRQDVARPDPRQGAQLHEPRSDGDPCDACPSCVAIREGRALDVVEIDAASNRGIDDVRELRDAHQLRARPTCAARSTSSTRSTRSPRTPGTRSSSRSRSRPTSSSSCSPRPHPQDFPPAILSRLQRFDVRRLTVAEIEGKLGADPRGRTAGRPTRRPIPLIARLAAGGMRDAESMLDQLLSSGGGPDRRARASATCSGLADAEAVDALRRRPRRRRRRGRDRAPRRARGARSRPAASSSTRSSTRSAPSSSAAWPRRDGGPSTPALAGGAPASGGDRPDPARRRRPPPPARARPARAATPARPTAGPRRRRPAAPSGRRPRPPRRAAGQRRPRRVEQPPRRSEPSRAAGEPATAAEPEAADRRPRPHRPSRRRCRRTARPVAAPTPASRRRRRRRPTAGRRRRRPRPPALTSWAEIVARSAPSADASR